MEKIIIAAKGRNHVIGKANRLPWELPADKAFFQDTIKGAWVIMGRRTFESQAVEGDLYHVSKVVLSRNPAYKPDNSYGVNSLEQGFALAESAGQEKLFILGGGQIYLQAMDFADKLILTEVKADFVGDTFFPVIDPVHWVEASRREYPADPINPLAYAFVEYRRKIIL